MVLLKGLFSWVNTVIFDKCIRCTVYYNYEVLDSLKRVII